MRLTCPNCGVEYEVPDGMVPAAGRHVQCTACHTRWFVRGGSRDPLSEDQILRRLETWRPRPVAVPDPIPPAAEPIPDPAPLPAPAAEIMLVPETAVISAAEIVIEATPEPLPPAPPPVPPAKPADRPSVPRPASLTESAPRPVPRLALGGESAPARPAEAPPPSRFGSGLVLALVLFGLAFGAYRYREAIAAQLPQAGPALDTYSDYIDRGREEVDRGYTDLRQRFEDATSE